MNKNVNIFIVPLILINKRLFKGYVGIIKFRGDGITKWKIV